MSWEFDIAEEQAHAKEVAERHRVPDGEHSMTITGSEEKLWEDGGITINLTIAVYQGPFAGRGFFVRLNVVNPANPAAEGPAKGTLAGIAAAVGVGGKMNPERISELYFKPFMATKVTQQEKYVNLRRIRPFVFAPELVVSGKNKTLPVKNADGGITLVDPDEWS